MYPTMDTYVAVRVQTNAGTLLENTLRFVMRVLLVDDHAILRAGVALLLRQARSDIEIVEAGTVAEGLEEARRQALNMVFLDLDLPDGHGFAVLQQLKADRPSLPVVIMSAQEDRSIIDKAIELHAMGFVPKSQNPDVLFAALQAALAGGVFLPASIIDRGDCSSPPNSTWPHGRHEPESPGVAGQPTTAFELGLTHREFDTLKWVVLGYPTKTIAQKMGVEDITIRKYVSNLLAHFNVRRRTELIVYVAKSGIRLGPPEVSCPDQTVGDPQ
jgi:two-component system, NarL family, nitrate/nitrite response regulator NarL